MRLSLRFVIPLLMALSLLAYAAVPLVDQLTSRWFMRDLDLRAQLIADSMQEPVAEVLSQRRPLPGIASLFTRVIRDERLYAVALCGTGGKVIYGTPAFPRDAGCEPLPPTEGYAGAVQRLKDGALYISRFPVTAEAGPAGDLVLIHDMSFIERRSADTRNYLILLFVVLAGVVSMITVLVAHMSWRGWIAGVKSFIRGEGLVRPFDAPGNAPGVEIRPLIGDVRALIREIAAERNVGEDRAAEWTPETLRRLLRDRFYGDQVIVVSNREPYLHEQDAQGLPVVLRPASGLVTAVEPVMRACSGTWIAHGSGALDRQFADENGRVAVPPDNPAYTLRRVWLSPEEEQGYYFGFANEGLWPLCHMAHVRPVFRHADWHQYVKVNRRFAETVVAEANTEDPVVLVQDYHLALVPSLIRAALPRATVIAFWHIPWPHQESFGICPWREEIIAGLLGSTILGFHTAQHCKNFLETVDRYMEARIEHESSTISHGGQLTRVASYPISIEWPATPDFHFPSAQGRDDQRARLGIGPGKLVALGVDRLDYTKGIVERLLAVEAMLERHAELRGRFLFIQIAAPTRSSLDEYRQFEDRVRSTAARINQRFGAGDEPPVLLLVKHHGPESVFEHYRACDVCMVTSLHDGMNLVAKEFVSARDDERGALVLSQFAGAARELQEALIVNPYDIDQTAEALYRALTMAPEEQAERMRAMRSMVRDFNIYRWAGRMLSDASAVRQRQRVLARISSHHEARLRRAI